MRFVPSALFLIVTITIGQPVCAQGTAPPASPGAMQSGGHTAAGTKTTKIPIRPQAPKSPSPTKKKAHPTPSPIRPVPSPKPS